MRDIANLDSLMREHLGKRVWVRVVHPELIGQKERTQGKVLRRREVIEQYGVLRRFAVDGKSLVLWLMMDGILEKIGVWNAETDEWFLRNWPDFKDKKPWDGLKESGDIK